MRQSSLLLLPLFLSLIACNGKSVEQALAPDPQLTASPSADVPTPSLKQSKAAPLPSPKPGLGGYTDLDTTPQELRPYLDDLLKLELIQRLCNPAPCTTFQPNQAIQRREYARWLIAANNRFYRDMPLKQIRLAIATAEPAFTDVPQTDSDFASIQGLAEAGLIPSHLGNDKAPKTFRPDAPLERTDLILWKVPLDIRKSPPAATVEQVKQNIGFQDIQKMTPAALNAIFADYQNGDQANFRRAFGYTTIFQPQRTVTRAEAAATLWYFGTQTDGRSAQTILDQTAQSQPATTPSP
jgi:hypothetical protein